jgi:organic radical activating enzyme
MNYPLAEKFKSIQGEGLFTGTPMAFVRMVGCSVGQGVCTHCDTDFDQMYPQLGGGLHTPLQIVEWAEPYHIICITGGEPLDRKLHQLVVTAHEAGMKVHVETSGTVEYDPERHGSLNWITVSPKPGFLPTMIEQANEIKVILGGLGDSAEGWPTVTQARKWAAADKLVYIQPCNLKHHIDPRTLDDAVAVVNDFPELRLSNQFHKFINVR